MKIKFEFFVYDGRSENLIGGGYTKAKTIEKAMKKAVKWSKQMFGRRSFSVVVLPA